MLKYMKNELVYLAAAVATILTFVFFFFDRIKGGLRKVWHFLTRHRPKVPRETIRILPNLSRTWWHMGSLNGSPAMQVSSGFYVSNITDKDIYILGTRIVRPRKARKHGSVLVRHPEQNIYGNYPIIPEATTEVSASFSIHPAVRKYGEDFKASVVLIDQYTNEHEIKNIVFKGDKPKEPKKKETKLEAIHSISDLIEKEVAAVLKAEVNRYQACGRIVGGLGSIQTTYKGHSWIGVGTRWRESNSPKNQAIVLDPDNAQVESDNALVLLNLYKGIKNDEERSRFISSMLKRLAKGTEYAPIGYIILVVLLHTGHLAQALETAKRNLQNDGKYGFSDFLRLLEGLLYYKHPSFTLEHLDDVEKFLEGIDEHNFNIPERIAAIRAFRLANP